MSTVRELLITSILYIGGIALFVMSLLGGIRAGFHAWNSNLFADRLGRSLNIASAFISRRKVERLQEGRRLL